MPQGLYFSKALFEGLIFGRAYIRRGLIIYGGKFVFQNRLGLALWLEGNLPFLLCFTLYLRAISKYISPQGAYIWRGDLTEGFLRYEFRGLIFGVAYTWRDLFSEFYGIFGTTVMSSRTYITQVLCDNNLITRAFKSDYDCAKIAVQL